MDGVEHDGRTDLEERALELHLGRVLEVGGGGPEEGDGAADLMMDGGGRVGEVGCQCCFSSLGRLGSIRG